MKVNKSFAALAVSFVMLLGAVSFPVSAYAAQLNGENRLTVEAAAKKAIDSSSSIKKSQEDELLGDDKIEEARDILFAATDRASMLRAEVNWLNLELERSLNLENITAQKENVEYSIMMYFNAIIKAGKDIELFEEALEIQKRDLDIAGLKLKLGLLSQTDYDTAALEYEKAVSAKLSYMNETDKAYRALNIAMGESADKRPELDLEFKLEYKPIDRVDLTQYTDTFINKSLAVKQAEDAKTVAEYAMKNYLDPYNPLTGEIYESYYREEQLKYDFNQASRYLEDTKKSVREDVIETYNSLMETEINIKMMELDLESARNGLLIMEKKLELGQATLLDTDKLKYGIKDEENKLYNIKNSYMLTAKAFSNPNILVGVPMLPQSGTSGAQSGQ